MSYQIEKADIWIEALSIYPAKRTKSALYHNSKLLCKIGKREISAKKKKKTHRIHVMKAYQSMIPEDTESFIIGNKSEKEDEVNPFHVRGHHPQKIYKSCPIIDNQLDIIIALIAPGTPKFSLLTKIHDKNTWRTNDAAESHPTIMFFIWDCKYLRVVKEKTKK